MKSQGDDAVDDESPPPRSTRRHRRTDPDIAAIPHDPETWKRYGAELKKRRVSLGLRHEDADGIVSIPVLSRIENGHGVPGRMSTWEKLDQFYRFEPGAIYKMFRWGEEPVPRRRRSFGQEPLAEYPVRLPLEALTEYMEAEGDLKQLAEAFRERADSAVADNDPQAMRSALEAIHADTASVQGKIARSSARLLRAWVIAQVEGRKADGVELDPISKPVLTSQLSREPVTQNDKDLDELRYLRWLLGTCNDLSAEDDARFTALFTERTRE
ncbi:hypothetical protein A9X06_26475 [Mycobacterium sp. 852002-51759_SCH5129042]|nr:hypothetical protein A9X06_26475 [Mycobacterium sp. 852002-51759_SCH5129042]